MQVEIGRAVSNPSTRSMRDPCDLNRRSASAVAGPDREIIGTDTLLELCPAGAQWIAAGKTRSAPPFFLERAECFASSAPQICFSITLFCFIFIHNILVQTYILWKLIDIFPVPLLGKGQAERRALFPGGRTARRASDLRERALDLIGKEEDRGSPVFIPYIRSICDSYEHRHYRSASAEAGQVLRGTLVKTSSSKRVFPPGAKHMQWKPLIMWAVAPLESRLCMLHSQSDHRTNCV